MKTFYATILAALCPTLHAAELIYDRHTGFIDLVAPPFVTTLELRSATSQFLGSKEDFPHFTGLFDSYTADRAFKLDASGFGDIKGFAQLPPGLTAEDLNADISPDGSSAGDAVDIPRSIQIRPLFCETSTTTVCIDFDSPLPDGTKIFGNAAARATGGNAGGGYLSVTDAANEQRGAIVFPPLGGNGQLVIGGRTGGANSNHHIDNIEIDVSGNSFSIKADVRIGGGSIRPADGFSFNFARPGDPVLDDGEGWAGIGTETNLPEEGTTTGIAIGFDEWQNARVGDTNEFDNLGLSIRVDGDIVGRIDFPTLNGALDDLTSLQTGPNTNGIDGLGWAKLEIDVTNVQSPDSFVGSSMRIAYKGAEVFAVWTPEPSSCSLFGIGLLGFGLLRLRV